MREIPAEQPFIPITRADCRIPPMQQQRDACFYDNEDWEGYECDDPTWFFWAECGTPAYEATMVWSGGGCCYEWTQECQDYYDQVAPVSCEADIPAHVDQNSQAFATVISTDGFCCSYQWDSWCDQLYEWSTPPIGCEGYTLQVSSGSVAGISWSFVGGSTLLGTGGAGATLNLCMLDGCFSMIMISPDEDAGWGGATWTLYDASNNTVASGGMEAGLQGTALVPVGYSMEYCTTPPDPDDPGGPGGPGGPIGPPPASASDCPGAIPVCTDLSFQITPNGFGAVYEIPMLGTVSNPNLPWQSAPWGGTNLGCLRDRERNSTWMLVNIWQGGSLEFTFGGLGTQVGFYDWSMWPYTAGTTCPGIIGNTQPPIRCNWNGASWGGTGLGMPPGGHSSNYEAPLNVQAGEQYLICFSNWSHVNTSVPLVFGGTAIVDCRDVTLPVELISFTGQKGLGHVQLNWITASEKNTSHFEVERSSDLSKWEVVAHVTAAGNSAAALEYTTTDRAPLPTIGYYRLRMVDTDGSQTHSPTVAVQPTATPRCWPNPAENGSFQVAGAPPGANVEVIDALGRLYHTGKANDQGALQLALPEAAPGLYLLRITANGHQNVQQISIQHTNQ